MARRGLFFSFEGIDGSGKSTQARRLAEALRPLWTAGVVLTREPGGSPGAEEIRALLVTGDPGRWSATTELLLFNAARRDHVERTILPAVHAGQIVVSDRFADSTRVYQGVAHPGLRRLADAIHAEAIGIEPDLTFVIDTDPEAALTRGLARRSGEDRFEDRGLAFQKELRAAFRALVEEFPRRCVLIDGNRSVEAVAGDVLARARARL
ncbi:MAG: dTMP kinase [Rhodobacteraceae bacterium]|nr:dTMP kinase [Paracoccaceae bacterium]